VGDRYDRIRERRDQEETYTIEGVSSLGSTDKAIVCVIPGKGVIPIPISQIHDDSEIFKANQPAGRLVVTSWLAEQRGWI
jgi:hypothetical protein